MKWSILLAKTAQGMTQDDIEADEDFCKLLASLKYLRVNYQPFSAQEALYETLSQPLRNFLNRIIFIYATINPTINPTRPPVAPGVGYSSSEKQRPGPLDLCLLFREVVDVKRSTGAGTSIREMLFSSIAEYNRGVNTKVGGVTLSFNSLKSVRVIFRL